MYPWIMVARPHLSLSLSLSLSTVKNTGAGEDLIEATMSKITTDSAIPLLTPYRMGKFDLSHRCVSSLPFFYS
jgi:hypothetical protein